MNILEENKMVVERVLIDEGVDFAIFRQNVKESKDGVLGYVLDLMGCKTEDDVIKLVHKYV